MTQLVYLNGEYLPIDEAKVSVLDRGFVFADGVYEVIPVYSDRLFRMSNHLQRLNNSLNAIKIDNPLTDSRWSEILTTLVEKNGGGDQSLYLQVTRGVAPRDHRFPENPSPTVFVMSDPLIEPSQTLQQGIKVISVEDIRWKWCQIKSISLLPNILMRQQAIENGATEAILIRDGIATEGTASNLFIVKDGVISTPKKSNMLLPGITRDLVVELCHQHGFSCYEQDVSEKDLNDADEIWITSSTKEIVPVIEINGEKVGTGAPGKMWHQLITLYRSYKQRFRSGEVE